jgi:hypothetical protein
MTDESTKYLDFIFVRMEAEIREKIAQEIEAKADETYYDEKEIWLEAAAIARGNNE